MLDHQIDKLLKEQWCNIGVFLSPRICIVITQPYMETNIQWQNYLAYVIQVDSILTFRRIRGPTIVISDRFGSRISETINTHSVHTMENVTFRSKSVLTNVISYWLRKEKADIDATCLFSHDEYVLIRLWLPHHPSSDAIRRQRYWSEMAHIVACCLTPPSHYMKGKVETSQIIWT